jgi:hypothetical protein
MAALAPPLSAQATSRTSTVPSYRIIYNWDGAPHDYSEFPQSLEQFLEKVYAPMKDTQVGAHFWCIGEHQAKWPSKALEIVGDEQNRNYDSVRAMRHIEGLRARWERGENPYQALVKRGHELGLAVFASVRMNDNHFNGLQPEDMAHASMEGLTQLRKEHPEWCLGAEQTERWFAASWNFAVPEVREHRLQHVSEVVGLADWDGIELDWQRHAFHLPHDDAWPLRYTLTDLQRAIRRMTRKARERGRPLLVAVRVATTMEACRHIGYDLPIWVKEGLCDIMIAGGGAGTDPGIDVEFFTELLRGSGIRFYTGFDGALWGEHHGLTPAKQWDLAFTRATAKGYWERGADGMYVFNWHSDERTRRPLLTTIGSPDTLRRTDKVYATLHRFILKKGPWTGADVNDRLYGETPVALYRTLSGDGALLHVAVHDDVAGEAAQGVLASVELHIEMEHFSRADQVLTTLDGNELSVPAVRNAARELESDPADFGESSWLVWPLRPEQAGRGTHEILLRLLRRTPRVKPPLVVRHAEIHVKYKNARV